MPKRRWFRLTHYFANLFVIVAVLVILSIIINNSLQGFRGKWATQIQSYLTHAGVHADFDSLRFDIRHGIVATNVSVFESKTSPSPLVEVDQLHFNVNPFDLMRGTFTLRQLVLQNAHFQVPIDPDNPDASPFSFQNVHAKLRLDDDGSLNIKSSSGICQKIPFQLDGHVEDIVKLLTSEKKETSSKKPLQEFLRLLQTKLSDYSFPSKSPPLIHLTLNLAEKPTRSTHLAFSIQAPQLNHPRYQFSKIQLVGDFRDNLLTVDSLTAKDKKGILKAKFDYSTTQRNGRFDLTSSLDIKTIFEKVLKKNLPDSLDSLNIQSSPKITAKGTFTRTLDKPLQIHSDGQISLKNFQFENQPFTSLESHYAWKDGNLLLTPLTLKDKKGTLNGQFLLEKKLIKYDFDSTLSIRSYLPICKADSSLRKLIQTVKPRTSSQAHLLAKGHLNRDGSKAWKADGSIDLTDFSYKGTAFKQGKTAFRLTEKRFFFPEPRATFDYQNDPMRNHYGGPQFSPIQAKDIEYDRRKKMLSIGQLNGTAWLVPIIQPFSLKIAKHITKYQTRKMPTFACSGRIDLSSPSRRTDLRINIRTNAPTDYVFLKKTIALHNLKTKLRVRFQHVYLPDLSFNLFGGEAKGTLLARPVKGKPTAIQGNFLWNNLQLKQIGKTYGFKKEQRGLITGQTTFSQKNRTPRSINGKGTIALSNGRLFSVPIFGPLSTLLRVVTQTKKIGYETAQDASCSFIIKNGIVITDNVSSVTPSFQLSGGGKIDLHQKNLDLHFCMRTKGLFGVLLLPIKPLQGIFQFKGTGSLSKPKWKMTPFRGNPFHGNKKNLRFKDAPRAIIVPE